MTYWIMYRLWFWDRPRLFVMGASTQTSCQGIRLPLYRRAVGRQSILPKVFDLVLPSKAFFAAADCIILLLKHVVTRIRLSGSIRLSVVELESLIRTKGRGRIVLPNWRGNWPSATERGAERGAERLPTLFVFPGAMEKWLD